VVRLLWLLLLQLLLLLLLRPVQVTLLLSHHHSPLLVQGPLKRLLLLLMHVLLLLIATRRGKVSLLLHPVGTKVIVPGAILLWRLHLMLTTVHGSGIELLHQELIDTASATHDNPPARWRSRGSHRHDGGRGQPL
jgi:hypothetical protein